MSHGDPRFGSQPHAIQRLCADGVSAPTQRSPDGAPHHEVAAQVVDRAMLQALLILPLQRVEDLALMVGVSLRTAYRHLDRLQACGLVDTLVPGNLGRASSQIAYLTRAGVRALTGGDVTAARRLARAWGVDVWGLARLLPRLPARITLLQSLPALLLTVRRSLPDGRGNQRARGVGQRFPGAPDASLLCWHWALEYRHAFTYRGRPRRLAVDGVLAVRAARLTGRSVTVARACGEQDERVDAAADASTTWHAVWVLLDPGVGNVRAFVPRLSALIAYRESSARWPLYAQFPPVLILTTSLHRASIWQYAAREAALHLRADPLAGVIQIAPPGSAACWPLSVPGTPLPRSVPEPASSWIDLTSGTPTTLAALVATSLPEAALPPGLTALPLAPLALTGVHAAAAESADTTNAAPSGRGAVQALAAAIPALSGGNGRRRASAPATRPRSKSAAGAHRPDDLSARLRRTRESGPPTARDSDQRTMLRASLALTLARREETVLDLLARHPLVCQDDLAAWMELAPAWIDRLRRQLRSAGLVQAFRVPRSAFLPLRPGQLHTAMDTSPQRVESAIPSPTETTYLLRLTPLAWNFLAAVYRLPARQLAGGAPQARASMIAPTIASSASGMTNRPHEPPRLPGKALHQASVYHFFTLLLQDLAARTRAECEPRERLLWWEAGVACVRRYRTMGRWGTLRPDAAGEYQCGGRRVHFWLEWDTGSMGLHTLREKLERYATYAHTRTWRLEEAHSLPVLLIVTPDPAQEARVARLVDELRQRARLQWPGPLLIRTTTASRLARHGPLAPIWLPLLPSLPSTMQTVPTDAESLSPTPVSSVRLMSPLEGVEFSIAMTEAFGAKLALHLDKGPDQEDLAFALWRPSLGRTRLTAILQRVVLPQKGEQILQGNVAFTAEYVRRVLELAEGGGDADGGYGIALLHSHLGPGWQDMSDDDEIAERERLAGAVAGRTGLPLVGLTRGTDGAWSGRFWVREGRRTYGRRWAATVRVVGQRLRTSYHPILRPAPPASDAHVATVSVWGETAQADLVRLRVGIVGVGSVGSIVAEALSRMGATWIAPLDHDHIEERNLDRTAGARHEDVAKATPKVRVAQRHIQETHTAASVHIEPFEGTLLSGEGLARALDCDVLFSCVDRPWPRHLLNAIAYAHLIPIVDGGIFAKVRDGRLLHAGWRIQIVGPTRQCLACSGALKPQDIAVDRAGKLDDPAYIQDLGPEFDPLLARQNVFPFSLSVAAHEVLQFVGLVTGQRRVGGAGPQVYHCYPGTMEADVGAACRPDCGYAGLLGSAADLRGNLMPDAFASS